MAIDTKKLKKVYDTLVVGGYTQGYDEFAKGFLGENNYQNRKTVYDLLSANGASIGDTYEDFMRTMQVQPAAQPAPKPATAPKPQATAQTATQQKPKSTQKSSSGIETIKKLMDNAPTWTPTPLFETETTTDANHNKVTKAKTVPGFDKSGHMAPVYRDVVTGKTYDPNDTNPKTVEGISRGKQAAEERVLDREFDEQLNTLWSRHNPKNGANAAEKAWISAEERNKKAAEKIASDVYRDRGDAMANMAFLGGRENRVMNVAEQSNRTSAVRMTNFDLDRLMNDSWNNLGASGQKALIDDCYKMLLNRYPGADKIELYESAKKFARQQSDLRLYNLAVEKNMPKDNLDYLIRKIGYANLLSNITKGLAVSKAGGKTGDMAAYEAANELYRQDGHKILDVAGTVAGMALDPTMWMSGGVGSLFGKGAMWAGGRYIAKRGATAAVTNAATRQFATSMTGRIVGGVVGGAANFGTFEGVKEIENQFAHGGHIAGQDETGKYINEGYSAEAVGKQFGHGLLMGGAIGWLSPVSGNVSDKLVRATSSTLGKVTGRAGVNTGATMAEGTIFSVPEWIEGDRDGFDVWTDNMAMMVGFKAKHIMKSAVGVLGDLKASFDSPTNGQKNRLDFESRLRMRMDAPSDGGLALTKDEEAELKRYGYDLRELVESQERQGDPNGGGIIAQDAPEIVSRLTDMVTDPRISEAARAKMYYYATGRKLPMSTVMKGELIEDGDGGYIVESQGANGVITSRSFKSRKEADLELQRINRQTELNSVELGERYQQTMDFEKRLQDACRTVASENGWDMVEVYRTCEDARRNFLRGGDKQFDEAQQNILRKVTDAMGEFEETGATDAMRGSINEKYGVDIDNAIRKEANRRTQAEQSAIDEYIDELIPNKAKDHPIEDVQAEDISNQKLLSNDSEQSINPFDDNGPIDPRFVNSTETTEYDPHQPGGEKKPIGHAVMKYQDRPVEVLSGRVVMMEDGTMVDNEHSDASIVIRDLTTGEIEMVSPDAILSYEEYAEMPVGDAGTSATDEAVPEASTEGQSKYTSGQIKIRNSDGTETRGVLTGYVDEDGNHEYYVEGDLQRLHYASDQELDGMLTEYIPNAQDEANEVATVTTSGEKVTTSVETPSETAEAQPAQSPAEAAVEPTPLQRIPRDEKGEPIFEHADSPETAWDALVEFSEGDASTAKEIADTMAEEKRKAYEKAQKQKPKGKTPAEILASKKANAAELAKAEVEYNRWQEMAHVQQQRENAIRAQQDAEARRLAAERAEAEKEERAAREEAERLEREALESIPEWHRDTPENARKRGVRRFNGQMFTRQEPVQGVAGKEVEVKFSQKDMPKGRVAVIEAEQLQPSHIQGQRNPMFFIEEAQPKNRAESVSRMAAQQMAEAIRPQEITGSATAYTGAPTVNTRGEVIQGNNRSDALRYLWGNSLPEQQNAYKQYIVDNAAQFGLYPDAVGAMQHPVLVNMLDVDDNEAIRLGQLTAQDTESGGVERIKPKNVAQKLGDNMRVFANRLLSSRDEEASFGQLVDRNGGEVLKWMNQTGAISSTQFQSAFDSKGNLTAEAKNDLQKVLYQSVFKGGSQQLEEMFDKLPAKAQRAILSTAFRDMDSPFAGKMLPEIQASIDAYTELLQDTDFASAKNLEGALRAVEAFKRQILLDDRFEQYMPADNFSNFALHLAAMYKANGMSQSAIASMFNKMYDLAQGKVEATLFEEADTTEYPLAEVIKKVLNIDYKPAKNGNNNVTNGGADVALRNRIGQGGELRGNEPPASGEQAAAGAEPSVSGARVADDSGRGGNQVPSSERRVGETKKNVDEKGYEFIVASDGTTDFGQITEDCGLTAAPIRLSRGYNDANGKGYGLTHIEANHGEQIRNAGFASVEEFVESVSKNYDPDNIRVGKRREDGTPTYLIQVTDTHDNTLFIELSKDGSYWNVNSGGVFRKGYANKKETVAKTEPQQPDNAVPTDSSLSDVGESGISTPKPNGEPTVSDGKNNTLSAEKQEDSVKSSLGERISAASADVNTEPTDAQKEAGNYKKGHVQVGSFDVTIEQPVGSVRRGKDANGKEWESEMHHTYGYIRGTEGVDGDHIDVFISADVDGWNGRKAFVIDQYNPDGSFDEHKVMLGFNDKDEAFNAYLSNYEKGWENGRRLDVTEVNLEDFEKWIDSSKRKTKAFTEYKGVKSVGSSKTETTTPAAVVSGEGYKVEPNPYTNKQGKTLDTYLVTFDRDFSKEEISALRAKAKELKGWQDRESKGWMLRSVEDAKAFAEDVIGKTEDEVADEAPLSMADMDALVKKVDLGGVVDALKTKGETKLSDHATTLMSEQGAQGDLQIVRDAVGKTFRNSNGDVMTIKDDNSEWNKSKTQHSVTYVFDGVKEDKNVIITELANALTNGNWTEIKEQPKPKKKSKWISEEDAAEFDSLRDGLRNHFGKGDMVNEDAASYGKPQAKQMDAEVLRMGTRMTYLMMKGGLRSFSDYCEAMKDELPDIFDDMRPHLKSLYAAAQNMEEVMRLGWDEEMDDRKTVKAFDVYNFDKPGAKDIIATAQHTVDENASQQQTEQIIQTLKDQRNEQRKQEDDKTSADTKTVIGKAEATASEVESKLETAKYEQDAERLSRSIDKEIEEVNKQLALLGYYEAEPASKDYNEAYGYMRNAERKATQDAHNLGVQLAKDLGLTLDPKDKVKKNKNNGFASKIAHSNVAPAYGEVSIRIPLDSEGKRNLYIGIGLQPVFSKDNPENPLGLGGSYGDNLQVNCIMYRVEDPTVRDRYATSNHYVSPKITYDEMLADIRGTVRHYLPDEQIRPADTLAPQPGEDLVKMAERVAKDSEEKKPAVSPEQHIGDLFSGLFDEDAPAVPANNVATETPKAQSEASKPLEKSGKGITLQGRSSEQQTITSKEKENGLQGTNVVHAGGLPSDGSRNTKGRGRNSNNEEIREEPRRTDRSGEERVGDADRTESERDGRPAGRLQR